MSSHEKNGIDVKTNRILMLIMTVLVLVITVGFVALPLFGMYGLYEILEKLGFVNINFYDSLLENITYFGFLILVIYLLTFILDLASKVIFLIRRKKFTKGTMILNYIIQVLLGTYLFEAIVEKNFIRIDVSLVGAFVMFSIIYLINYAILDDNDYM